MRIKLVLLITLFTNTVFAQWITQNSGTTEWLRGVWFTHADTGFVVGYNGTIIKTVDGGTNWLPQTSNTTNHLMGVFFVNSSTGWAVGISGTILKTTNGGTNWVQQTSPSNSILHQAFFVDANHGYIAGESGRCLKTINGGTTWTALTATTGNGKVSLFFNNVDTGYISGIGTTDAIIKTVNGGTSWSNIYNNNTQEFSSICFTNLNIGFAVDDVTGAIATTNNAGVTWTTQSLGNSGLSSIKFPSASIGFTVGGYPNNSNIFTTTNGGANWIAQNSSTTEPLFDVFFVNTSLGYAVGKNGTIIKTSNSGVGIKEYEKDNLFSIYPNPCSSSFSVSSSVSLKSIKLIDSNGRVVKDVMSFPTENISTADLAAGLYILELVTENSVSRKKIVIQKG